MMIDKTYSDERTIEKVCLALEDAGILEQRSLELIYILQRAGILFREPIEQEDTADVECTEEGDSRVRVLVGEEILVDGIPFLVTAVRKTYTGPNEADLQDTNYIMDIDDSGSLYGPRSRRPFVRYGR